MKLIQSHNKNLTEIQIGNIIFYFSYETCVAFDDGYDLVVCENIWGPTTGKHLNSIDGGNKKDRLSYEEFNKRLNLLEQTMQSAMCAVI